MKTALGYLLSAFLPFYSFAATITANSSGNWTSASTWDLNRAPQNNDQVIIPFGRTVFVQNTPYSKNDVSARPSLNIDVYGALDFSDAGNDKMYLGAGSTIEIFLLGKIQTSTSSSEIIAIFNGSEDNTVWTGSPSEMLGPMSAHGTSSGFQNALLPIKLDFFHVQRTGKIDIELSWQTSEEVNSSHFDVERLDVSSNRWQTLGRIQAAGSSTKMESYQFRCVAVSGRNEFRLKQVDIDGRYSYSPVRTLNSNDQKLILRYSPRTRTLHLQGADTRGLEVGMFSLNGSLIQKIKVTSASSLQFERDLSGVVVVVIFEQQRIVASEKLLL